MSHFNGGVDIDSARPKVKFLDLTMYNERKQAKKITISIILYS
jgi:hypothetical protein